MSNNGLYLTLVKAEKRRVLTYKRKSVNDHEDDTRSKEKNYTCHSSPGFTCPESDLEFPAWA